jgi:transposase
MNEVSTIGVDLAKSVFQLHGVDAEGRPVLRRQLRRSQVLEVFQRLPACLVGMEACASAHCRTKGAPLAQRPGVSRPPADPRAVNAIRAHLGKFGIVTPKPHSTGGQERLGRISKMGNRYLRRLLYLGAVVSKARLRRDAQVSARRRGQAGEDGLWKIIERKKPKQAAIARQPHGPN